MQLSVLGAGAWGTAIAQHAAARHRVRLWARHRPQVEAINRSRRNEPALPGVVLHDRVSATDDLVLAIAAGPPADLIVVATSVAGLRPVLKAVDMVQRAGRAAVPLLWLCKGIEDQSELLPHQVARATLADTAACGVLSGPSFAQEVVAGLPVALTVASVSASARERAVDAFHHGAMRIYSSEDLIGVELAGALKNVMAIAAGISDGLQLGLNARAALISRGLSEIARLGQVLGARNETFMGLTGVGDLVLTCTGDLSRNRRVGLGLAQGQPLPAILAQLGHVAEGVACARAALRLGTRHGVELPIVAAVCAVLDGALPAREAVTALLAREPRSEL